MVTGSPPPMRGKGRFSGSLAPCVRITPAYAGKRWLAIWRQCYREDHPRLCGEKLTVLLVTYDSPGSPPPMRGKGLSLHIFHTSCRITPAYAGKRPPHRLRGPRSWDHPRLCGEKGFSIIVTNGGGGITPAYAGKSRTHSVRQCLT